MVIHLRKLRRNLKDSYLNWLAKYTGARALIAEIFAACFSSTPSPLGFLAEDQGLPVSRVEKPVKQIWLAHLLHWITSSSKVSPLTFVSRIW
jgi:hypothetical protein